MSAARLRNHLVAVACGLAACAALPPAASAAEVAAAPADPAQRPRIGLVLAGGGAKGGAHVGVIKVLEEMRVPVDCIAGTSMGALVGAGYAAGLPAAELESFIRGIDWKAIVGGAGTRPLEPIEQKLQTAAAASELRLGVKDGALVVPAGLASTAAIDDLLRTYVAKARMVANFDRLPIPYRAVATDMVSGDMVVLKSGDLATAMRASMAIPGAFAPVEMGDYVLSDGGMVRNIPVDVARDTCAEVVIVVNLVEPPATREKLKQSSQLLARSTSVMLEANEKQQLATLTDRDVRIDVPMGDIGTSDFERTPETIGLGEKAARQVAGQLARYAVAQGEYVAWRNRVTVHQEIEARIAAVRFEGLQRVNEDYLRSRTRIKPGDVVDIQAISDDARRMATVEDIDSVAYTLEGDPERPTLVWRPTESSVGMNVLRPSLGIYAGGSGDFKLLVGVQFASRWLNDRGGQWRSTAQLGYRSLLSTGFYQPFDVAQRWFVEPQLFGSRSSEDVYVDGGRVAVYEFTDLGGRVDLGVNLSNVAQLRVGYLSTQRRTSEETGIKNLPNIGARIQEVDARDAGMTFDLTYDSRDDSTFARKGLAAEVQYLQSDTSLGADRDWSRVEGGMSTLVPFGRNAMWLSLAGGTDTGSEELPGDRAFVLGGPRTLPAYPLDEFRVRSYWLASLDVMWRLVDIVPVKNQALYLGFGLAAAGLYDRLDRVADGEVYSGALVLGGPTPLGTMSVGVGGSEDSWAVWLQIGRPVGKGSILNSGLFR